MASELHKKLLAYQSAYYMKPYRNVKIFPSILTKKRSFTKEEKKHLTRPGFRWYVYYDYLDPNTNEFKRQTPVTEGINRNYKDFDERLEAVKNLKIMIVEILKDGFDPYNKEHKDKIDYTIPDAIDFAVEIKKNEVGEIKTYERYKGTARSFNQWLKKNGYATYSIKKADKKLISEFLRHISSKASNRTRNNYRGDLSALFGVLLQEDYVTENPVRKTKALDTKEKRDPTYSDEQVDTIMTYLENNDKVMHLFILMVSYMFWRPIEITRIQVKDVNLKQRLISERTKTKGHKTKLIPEILMPYLEEYIKGSKPEDYLFTPNGTGQWEAKNKRSYFTRRYASIKKELSLDPEYTIYSFRHTFVTRAYKRLRANLSKEKALNELAIITGHTSKAIQAYIHVLDADTTEDYSHLL